jgi:hypothetical protein
MELLNIVGKGDISKESFEGICELCIQCSRGLARNRQGIRSVKGSGGGVTKIKNQKPARQSEDGYPQYPVSTDGYAASKAEAVGIGQDYGNILPNV